MIVSSGCDNHKGRIQAPYLPIGRLYKVGHLGQSERVLGPPDHRACHAPTANLPVQP